MCNPLVLAELIRAVGSGTASASYLYTLAALFLVFALLAAVLLQQHHDNVCRSCHVVRVMMICTHAHALTAHSTAHCVLTH